MKALVFHFTLPNRDHFPAQFTKFAGIFFVVGDVGGEFLVPEFDVG